MCLALIAFIPRMQECQHRYCKSTMFYLIQRTCMWNSIGRIYKRQRNPENLAGLCGWHTPSARTFNSQENKISQEASCGTSQLSSPVQKGSRQDESQGEATMEESWNAAKAWRDRVRKTKFQPHLRFRRDVKGNKIFYCYISHKRLIKQTVGALQDRMCDLEHTLIWPLSSLSRSAGLRWLVTWLKKQRR